MAGKPYQLDPASQPATITRQSDEMFRELYARPEPIEGFWAPIDVSGGSLTFADTAGRYLKFGNWVVLNGYVKYPTTADTNSAKLGGLPFTVESTLQNLFPGTLKTDETTAVRISINTSSQITPTTSADAAITNATLSTNYLYFTIIYRVS